MALIERRIDGGNVAFCSSIRWIEPVCGPSFGYLRLLGRYGCGNGWSSILRTVLGLMPISRAICRMETPFRRTRSRIPDHCATSRYMIGPSFRRVSDNGRAAHGALGAIVLRKLLSADPGGTFSRSPPIPFFLV